jgi:SAM-dependent methyltransferase
MFRISIELAVKVAVPTLDVWERAEVARSATEAALTPPLRPTPPSIVGRYADARADTPFALEYAHHLMGDVRGLRVLDLGCGSGGNACLLAARGAAVWAMDISSDLLALTARRAALDNVAARVRPIRGSAHAIPLGDGAIDLVFGNAVLHHLSLDLAAREVRRVLARGGRAVFREPIRNSRLASVLRRLVPYRQADVSPFERPLCNADVAAFAAMFDESARRDFELPLTRLATILKLWSKAQTLLRRCDRTALARWPSLRVFAAMTVLEVRVRGCSNLAQQTMMIRE